MMQERGVFVDHTTVHRWAIKMLPVLAAVFRRRKRPVGLSWRMDETYIKVAGQWKYLYRAVDRAGDTVDFLLTAKRDLPAARRFLERAISLHDLPEKITIDKSGANTAAIESVKADACVDILMRQNKYRPGGTVLIPISLGVERHTDRAHCASPWVKGVFQSVGFLIAPIPGKYATPICRYTLGTRTLVAGGKC